MNVDELISIFNNNNQKAVTLAEDLMLSIEDKEHSIEHMYDTVNYTALLLTKLEDCDIDKDVCLMSAYWHDIGRKDINIGHERLSAAKMEVTLEKLNYDSNFIKKCYKAIENHKWNMQPETVEGLVLKDADKLAWLGELRWKACLENNQRLDGIIELLPKLRNEILYFEESREIYDKLVVNIVQELYNHLYK